MPDPAALVRARGWSVQEDVVVVPLGQRRHAVRAEPDPSGGWLLVAEVPQAPAAGGTEELVRRNRGSGLAWFARDDDDRLVVRSAVPADAEDDELELHLRATARLADDHERLVQERDLL